MPEKQRKALALSARARQANLVNVCTVFSYEKLFNLQAVLNCLVTCISADSLTLADFRGRIVNIIQHLTCVMICGAIWTRRKIVLVFIEPYFTVDRHVHLRTVLQDALRRCVDASFNGRLYVLQQGGYFPHTAKSVQECFTSSLPAIIWREDCLASSPDLNVQTTWFGKT